MTPFRILLIALLFISISSFAQPRYVSDTFWGFTRLDVEKKEGGIPDYITTEKSSKGGIDHVNLLYYDRKFAGYNASVRYHFSKIDPKEKNYVLRWITYQISTNGNGLSPLQVMDEMEGGINRNRPNKLNDAGKCREEWSINVIGMSKDEGMRKGIFSRTCTWGGLETQLSYNKLGYIEVTYSWPVYYTPKQ